MRARTQLCLVAVLLLAGIAPLVLPDWFVEADRVELESMYPRFGGLAFIFLRTVPVFRFALAIVVALWVFHRRSTFNLALNGIGTQLRSASDWFRQDQLENRGSVAHLFLRALALVYLIAFASVLWQKELFTATGLLPVAEFADVTLSYLGVRSFWVFPSLFWISQADWFIILLLGLNALIAAFSVLSKPRPLLFGMLWAGYLSIVTFGRDVFQFPWDTFLLELGFLAIPLAYSLRRSWLPRFLVLAFLVLFFRQWLSMAMTKLLWSDPVWHDLTYMSHFWLNQPSPTVIGCRLASLPMWAHKTFSLVTIMVEMLIPISMLVGRRGLQTAFVLSLVLSVLIQIGGNFGFFNVLTVVAGVWCLDDRALSRRFLSERMVEVMRLPRYAMTALVAIILFGNAHYTVNLFIRQYDHGSFLNYSLGRGLPKPIQKPLQLLSHWRIVSPHGVFKGIPKERVHLSIQAVTESGDCVPMRFANGRDILEFSHVAPFMNRLPFVFFYQSYGIEFRSFLTDLNPNSHLVDSWMQSLLAKLPEEGSDVRKLATFDTAKPISHLMVQQKRYDAECLTADCLVMCDRFTLRDSETVLPGQRMETPLFGYYKFR